MDGEFRIIGAIRRIRIIARGTGIREFARLRPGRNVPGGIIEKEMSVHISNVALFNPITKRADRVGIKILEDGRKVRYFKSNSEVVDV